jgi:hypothetical protein
MFGKVALQQPVFKPAADINNSSQFLTSRATQSTGNVVAFKGSDILKDSMFKGVANQFAAKKVFNTDNLGRNIYSTGNQQKVVSFKETKNTAKTGSNLFGINKKAASDSQDIEENFGVRNKKKLDSQIGFAFNMVC